VCEYVGVWGRRREVRKVYMAQVLGAPPMSRGVVQTEIGRSRHDRKKMAANVRGGRHSESAYELVEQAGPLALLRVRIATGRTHQIRVHMAHIGCPVAGDQQYGRPGRDRNLPVVPPRQMLHAAELEFTHPIENRPICLTAPLPSDFVSVLEAARESMGA
jgi:23S rRNA pseudouridine1911/1915/1917 synthase